MKTRCIFFLSIVFLLSSCGSSRSTSRDRITVSSFNKIVSSSGIDICFSQNKSNYVEIESGSNVAVEVKNSTLIFNRRDKKPSNREKSTVYIYGNNVDAIILSGGSGFNSDELKNGKPFSIAASGGSTVRINKLDVDDCSLALSGGADCNIKQLKSKRLNVATSGGSNVDVNIEKSSNVNLASSGGSSITASGKTQDVSLSVSGKSDVNITNLKYDNLNTHQSKSGSIRK
ncbi:MAG: GIN domain-containing protein [Dysgonomonas sp.]